MAEVSVAQRLSGGASSSGAVGDKGSSIGRDMPQLRQHEWCGQYAISSDSFSPATVGAKSLNTHQLRVGQLVAGCLPSACDI